MNSYIVFLFNKFIQFVKQKLNELQYREYLDLTSTNSAKNVSPNKKLKCADTEYAKI